MTQLKRIIIALSIGLFGATVATGKSLELEDSELIFQAGEAILGGPLYTNYREPVVVRTKGGKLIVGVPGGNRLGWPERSGQDLVVRTSSDNGKSWGPLVVAAEHGDYSCQCHGLVYDAQVDRVLFLYTVYNWSYREVGKGRGAKFTRPIYKRLTDQGKPLVSSYIVHSDDGGETWSKPREITTMVGTQAHFGASEGRQLTVGRHAGRLVVPGSRMDLDPDGTITHKHLGVWLSDDHGETWRRSEVPMAEGTNTPRNASSEARVTEFGDGTLLYNQRTRNTGRHLSWSKDGGETWSRTRRAPDLQVTQCNGSMVTLRDGAGKLTDTVLFSVPSPGGRSDGLLYRSSDGGKTWPDVWNSIAGNFAYSALVQIDAGTAGLFYETNHYRDIRLVRFQLSQLGGDPD